MKRLFTRFVSDQAGATSIEYVLIGGIISIAIVVGATALGGSLNTTFSDMSTHFKGK